MNTTKEDLIELFRRSPEYRSEPFTRFQALLYIWLRCNPEFEADWKVLAKEWCWTKSQLKEFFTTLGGNKVNLRTVGDMIYLSLSDPDNLFTFTVSSKATLPFSDEQFEFFWKNWLAYRRDNKWKKYTEKGLKRFTEELLRLSKGNSELACKIMYQSMMKGWQGIFPLKQDTVNEIKSNNLNDYKQAILNKVRAWK